MAPTLNADWSPKEPTRWDWWPLARLLTVIAVFGAVAYGRFGWTPDLAAVAALPRRVFEVLSFCALISFGLAHLYLILLMFPIFAVVTLNDTFYAGSHWLCRVVLRMRSGQVLALSGLCGEIVLFGGLGLLIRRLLFGL